MKLIGIYCIRNKISHKSYIGMSTDINRRSKVHFRHPKNAIGDAIKKYGEQAFVVEILELCPEHLLNDRECHWISAMDCRSPNGYNLLSGGSNDRHSIESRLRMSKIHTGKKLSKKTKRKVSLVTRGSNNGNYGRKHTAEARQKISKSRVGKPSWNKGKNFSVETKAIMSQSARKRSTARPDVWKQSHVICKLYLQGDSVHSLAKKLNTTDLTIKRLLIDNKIPIRTLSESQKLMGLKRRESHPLQLYLFEVNND